MLTRGKIERKKILEINPPKLNNLSNSGIIEGEIKAFELQLNEIKTIACLLNQKVSSVNESIIFKLNRFL